VAILLGLAVAAGLSIAAWTTGLILYADGALFSFIVGIDDAWAPVWHLMPARIAVYLASVLPAETALEWGLPAPAAMRLYQALFIGFPFIGLAGCLLSIPRGGAWLTVFPVLSLLALNLSALGYPSETMLTLGAFWPALFGYRYARGRLVQASSTLLFTAIFLFSHPGMVLALPLLPLAAALRWCECREEPVRRELIGLGGLAALLLGLWVQRFGVEMSDPAFAQGGQRMWSPSGLQAVVSLQPAILIVLVDLGLWAVCGWRRDWPTRWAAMVGFPVIALLFALMHRDRVTPESHYYIRTALVILLPLLGGVALWRGRAAPSGVVAMAMIGALSATQLQHDLNFLAAWTNYRDSVAASVATGPARIVPLSRVLAERTESAGDSIAWSWGQPYLSLTLPGLPRYRAIVADPAPESHSPFHCSQMDAIAARADWVPEETMAVLKEYVCARRPE